VVVLAGPHLLALVASQEIMTIPFVFNAAEDPVELGVVTSLSRPGGNLTGVYHFSAGLEGKRLGLLRELVPKAANVAVLVSSNYPPVEAQLRDVQEAASGLGIQLVITRASPESNFDAAFESMVRQYVDALLVCSSPFFFARHQQLVGLAARHAIPAIYERRDFAEAGGLMSYGTSLTDAYRQMGLYAGRIVKGDQPADLPVVQSTKFDFVINLKTAKALGVDVPPTLLARTDEVIE
jgi:putative ABC transport system substrate-binding protein